MLRILRRLLFVAALSMPWVIQAQCHVATSPVSAIVSWSEGLCGSYVGATVEYKVDTADVWTTLPTVTGTYTTITGLTPETLYQLRVTTVCSESDSTCYTTEFITGRFGCLVSDSSSVTLDTVINGTATSGYIPSYSYYEYSLSQQIFTAGEIEHGGQISSIFLKPSAIVSQRLFEIYMGHTPLTTASSFIYSSDLTMVYSGAPVVLTANQWIEFPLTTPFDYNGSDNLLVYVRDISGSWENGNRWYGDNSESGISRYVYQDDAPIAVGTASGGTASSFRSNIIIAMASCSQQNTCAVPAALVIDVAATTVDVAWAPGSSETSWNLFYRMDGDDSYTTAAAGVTATSYQFANLNSGNSYEFLVEAVCDTQHLAAHLTATTQCAAIGSLPFVEDFNSWGSGVGALPVCWYRTGTYSNYAYIYSTYNHSGTSGGSVYMYQSSSADNKSWLIMPAVDSGLFAVNQLQLVYSMYTTASYNHPPLEIGVMSDPDDISTFVTVDTAFHLGMSGVWDTYEVPLSSYTGNGTHVAMRTVNDGDNIYFYIDDVVLELIPVCSRPDNLTASNVTPNSVDLGWDEHGSAGNWIVEYGPVGFALGTGTTVATDSNPFTLTGLPPSFYGDYYVRSVCSSTDTGDYSYPPCTFGTTQVPASLPYDCNFEDAAEWSNWQTCSNVITNWYRGTAVADAGSYSMYVSADAGVTYKPYQFNEVVNATAYRDIDFGEVDSSFTMTFAARAGGNLGASYDGLAVLLVDDSLPANASEDNLTSPWGDIRNLYVIAEIRVDTNWNDYTVSLDTIHGVHRVAFYWFNQNTENIYTYGESLMEPAAVDNIHIDYSTCSRPVAITVGDVSSSSASLSWSGPATADYEVAYRQLSDSTQIGFAYTNTNSIVLTGLAPLSQYVVYVRKICGNDTSIASDGISLTTALCDDIAEARNFDTLGSVTTSDCSPIGCSYYEYSYVQTIVTADSLTELNGDISALAFNTMSGYAGDFFTGMNVWLANIGENDLTNGFIHPDATHEFVPVIVNGDFSFNSGGWNIRVFDSTFTWDGVSNVLVAVSREHGSWESGATFMAHYEDAHRTRYVYRDSSAFDYTTVTGGFSSNVAGDLKLISCAGVTCVAPSELTMRDVSPSTVSLSWTPGGDEIAWRIHIWNDEFDQEFDVATNPATVTGLPVNATCNATVSALCDGGQLESDPSEAIQFVTGLEGVDYGTQAALPAAEIYPNPTTGTTTIALSGVVGDVTVTIVDINGRTVRNFQFRIQNPEFIIPFDLTGLPAGSYFVRIIGEGINTVKKLVVK